MIQEIQGNEKTLFLLDRAVTKDVKIYAHKIKKIASPEAALARYLFEMGGYENGKPIPVVKKMAEAGFFTGYFSHKAERLARKKGVLPAGFQIHHIVPLKLGGTSEISNLCVVDAETHAMMHQLIYQPILNKLKIDDEGILFLPEFKKVITKEDRPHFFLYSELRRHEYKKKQYLKTGGRKIVENRNSDMGLRDAFRQVHSRTMMGF